MPWQRLRTIFLIFAASYLVMAAAALAQGINEDGRDDATQPKPTLPAVSVAPWTTYNIDSRERTQIKNALDTAWNELAQIIVPEPTTLTETTGKPATLNRTRLLARFSLSRQQVEKTPLLIAPIICGFFDHALLIVTASDAATGELRGLAQRLITPDVRKTFRDYRAKNSTPNLDAAALAREVLANLKGDAAIPDHSLHVGFAAGKGLTRMDETSPSCLDSLFAAELLKIDHIVVDPLSEEHRLALRGAFGYTGKVRRPTRTLITRWHPATQDARTLPVKVNLDVTAGESVFGSPLDKAPTRFALEIVENGGRLAFPPPEQLLAKLASQKSQLAHQDLPQISKIYGAWVYLDRGRAWGLKMDDRLVVGEGASGDIKGHVVGFFGPGLKLKSPRGFAIEEGAIVYIREGQKAVDLGMGMTFDPKRFPAH